MGRTIIFFMLALYTVHGRPETEGAKAVDPEEEIEDLCKETFIKNPSAGCILYEDDYCDGDDALVSLSPGQSITFPEKDEFHGKAESVSVKKGCQLTVYSGYLYSGKYHTYVAHLDDLHVTFENEEHEALQAFDENVNSAVCSCAILPLYQPAYIRFPFWYNTQYNKPADWYNNLYRNWYHGK